MARVLPSGKTGEVGSGLRPDSGRLLRKLLLVDAESDERNRQYLDSSQKVKCNKRLRGSDDFLSENAVSDPFWDAKVKEAFKHLKRCNVITGDNGEFQLAHLCEQHGPKKSLWVLAKTKRNPDDRKVFVDWTKIVDGEVSHRCDGK